MHVANVNRFLLTNSVLNVNYSQEADFPTSAPQPVYYHDFGKEHVTNLYI